MTTATRRVVTVSAQSRPRASSNLEVPASRGGGDRAAPPVGRLPGASRSVRTLLACDDASRRASAHGPDRITGVAAPNQPMVFGTEPGETDYSPLWDETIVRWKAG